MATDGRSWGLYGEQTGPMAGRTTVVGPALNMGERLRVVSEARAVAAELEAGNLRQRIIKQGRKLADCDEKRMAAEQRVAELEGEVRVANIMVDEHAHNLRASRAERDALRKLVCRAAPFVNAVAAMADDKAPSLAWLADAALAASVTKEET